MRHGDFRDPGTLRKGERFDLVLGSPPYFAPGGVFACVFPEEQRSRVESAAAGSELAIVRRRPVIFREGEPPLVTLFLMTRGDDLPDEFRRRTWVEPALVIRTRAGAVHHEYAAMKLAARFPP